MVQRNTQNLIQRKNGKTEKTAINLHALDYVIFVRELFFIPNRDSEHPTSLCVRRCLDRGYM